MSRDIQKVYQRTIFLRSNTDIKRNADLLIVMNIFGLKNVHLELTKMVHEIFHEDM
jgi:hypothetical protein